MFMQRFISALSLTLLLTGFAAVAQVQPQLLDPIDRVVAAGLMQRDSNGDFQSDAILNRAELASILVKTFRLESRTPTQSNTPEVQDVPLNHWAYEDIQIVIRTGVMSGYQQGRFYPNQLLTRGEAFSIFAQAYGVSQFSDETVNQILAAYPDADQIPIWARKSMATALYSGFINLDASNQIRPDAPMTRADMAYALNQFLIQAQSPDGLP